METLDRATLMGKLADWQQQLLSSEDLWHWALEVHEKARPADEVVGNVLDLLATLPEGLMLPEDAVVLLDALGNPPDEADLSINLLWNYPDIIDLHGRRKALADDPFYGPYCAD
ncbi:MAG: hypothetical protein EVA67_07975 [OM182 bacterium]|nr:MAG: hypothetical protein EVA67_07975 [OM182 bacterium]